jgi:hypothetical protein
MRDPYDAEVPDSYCYLDKHDRAHWRHWCLDHYENAILPLGPWRWLGVKEDDGGTALTVIPSLRCDRCGKHGLWIDRWLPI